MTVKGTRIPRTRESPVYVRVACAGKNAMSGVERLEPVQIEPEGELRKKQEGQDGHVHFGLLDRRYGVAEEHDPAPYHIKGDYEEEREEEEEAGIGAQRFVEGKLEKIKADIAAKDGVYSPRIHSIEVGEHLGPEIAAPKATHNPEEGRCQEAERLEYLDEFVRVECDPYAAHQDYIGGRYLDVAGDEDVDSGKDEKEQTEGKACRNLGGHNLGENFFKTDFTEEKPVHVNPGRLRRAEKESDHDNQE